MVSDTESEFLKIACQAAREAGAVLKERFFLPKKVFFKGSIDLVTDADKASETVILKRLKEAFPTHNILSEESDYTATKSPFLWVVDPLDGTTNFAHGYPCFSVSIALLHTGQPIIGVVYNPMTDECYAAIRFHGATRNDQPIRVSETVDIQKALLCTGFPYDVGQSERNNIREFSTVVKRAQGVRRDGSAALDLCRVAEGSFDGFWELKLKPWDVAAGALIAMEAGGMVTTFDGLPFDPFKDTILSTNGRIHEELRKLLSRKNG